MKKYIEQGLSESQIGERFKQYGENTIAEKKEIGVLEILIEQFKSPLIYILIIATVMTVLLGDYTDAVVIALAVAVNTVLGFYQEYKAQKGLVALRSLLSPKATVIREGKRQIVDAIDLVPGDVCLVGLGEKIPADGLVITAEDFSVTEAILTGESVPVHKSFVSYKQFNKLNFNEIGTLRKLAKKDLMVFAGTTVSSGDAIFVVTVTGPETEVGKIAESLKETIEEATPLQKRIHKLSNQLAALIGFIALIIFVAGLVLENGEYVSLIERFEVMFTTSVALAVAAIPEGLAVSLTVILAIGMQRILKQKAIVRKLVAAETLGSVTCICADKTGTLTEGMMRVAEMEFTDKDAGLRAVVLTNDQRDSLEVAMWNWVKEKKGQDPKQVADKNERLGSIPFSPEEKFSAKLYKDFVYVIGAPEVVLSFCSLAASRKARLVKKFESYGNRGLRIVGLAMRKTSTDERRLTKKSVKSGMRWLGLVAFEDPVRQGVAKALKEAKRAGIHVKVITGDYRATAEYVLEKLGLMTKSAKMSAKHSLVIVGDELDQMSKEELRRRVNETVLFARIDPVQKLKIVEALKENGEVVAMTGDGVNDAPALKKADIGIVVSGATDVAKETADMVLLDDNFSTVISAVEEGRGIFENLRKVILYLLSDSFSEVVLVLGSMFLKIPLPLTAAQILWINLITDGFPDLALTVEPKDDDLMQQKPRDPNEPLINLEIKLLIGLISGVTGIITLVAFYFLLGSYHSASAARSVVFAMLGIDSLVYVFSARSLRHPIWRTSLFLNPWLILAAVGGFIFQLIGLYAPVMQNLLQTRPLTGIEWLIVLAEVLLVIGIIEGVKYIFIRRERIQRSWVKALNS